MRTVVEQYFEVCIAVFLASRCVGACTLAKLSVRLNISACLLTVHPLSGSFVVFATTSGSHFRCLGMPFLYLPSTLSPRNIGDEQVVGCT